MAKTCGYVTRILDFKSKTTTDLRRALSLLIKLIYQVSKRAREVVTPAFGHTGQLATRLVANWPNRANAYLQVATHR